MISKISLTLQGEYSANSTEGRGISHTSNHIASCTYGNQTSLQHPEASPSLPPLRGVSQQLAVRFTELPYNFLRHERMATASMVQHNPSSTLSDSRVPVLPTTWHTDPRRVSRWPRNKPTRLAIRTARASQDTRTPPIVGDRSDAPYFDFLILPYRGKARASSRSKT